MKRKITARLSLNRETIRSLEHSELRFAGGETQVVACYTEAPSCRKPCSAHLTCAVTCTATRTTTTTETQ